MPRGALETRQLRLEFGHASSFDAQLRGMRAQVHRHKPCEGFLFPRRKVYCLEKRSEVCLEGLLKRQQGEAGADATVHPRSLMPMHRLLMSSNPSLRDGRPESAGL